MATVNSGRLIDDLQTLRDFYIVLIAQIPIYHNYIGLVPYQRIQELYNHTFPFVNEVWLFL